MLTPFCNSFTVKRINFTAADQPAAPGIGLSQPFRDKGAQMASFNFVLPKHLNPVWAQPCCPTCVGKHQRESQPHFHLWHQDLNRSSQSRGTCTLLWCRQGIQPKSPGGGWRMLLEASKTRTTQPRLSLSITVFKTCSEFLVPTTESKNVLWAQETSDKQSLIDTELP